MNRYIIYILWVALVCVGVSCTDEAYQPGTSIPAGQEYNINVRLRTSDFHVTRSMNEDQEATITKVWVAQFDQNGDLKGIPQEFSSYSPNTPLTITVESSGSAKHKLYFVTNMVGNPFTGVSNESGFLAKSFTHNQLVLSDGLVMMGVCETVLAGPTVSTSDILVYVDKLTAKLELVVQVDLDKFKGFQSKKFRVDTVQIGAVAKEMIMQSPVNDVGGSKATEANDVTDLLPVEFTAQDPSSTTSLHIYKMPICYILENMQGDLGDGNADKKNIFAPKDTQNSEEKDIATYITIIGSLDNGVEKGKVKYKIYLGKDDHTSFNIERNTHYKVTVTLTGNLPTDTEVDVRIDTDKVAYLQLCKPDGSAATNRDYETIQVGTDVTSWDGGGYYVDSGNDNDEWGFKVTSGSSWASLKYEKSDGMTDDSYVEGTGGKPNGKFQIIMQPNTSALARTAIIIFSVTKNGTTVEREWRITQGANTNLITIPPTVYIEANAGYYAIPVRAAASVEWKCISSSSSSIFKIEDHITGSGVKKGATGSVDDGNGLIILDVQNHNPSSAATTRSTTLTLNYAPLGGTTMEAKIIVRQLPPKSIIIGDPIYNFQPSTSPAYEEAILGTSAIPWGMNDLGKKYLEKKDLLTGMTSRIDGKGNTYKLYKTFEQDMIVNMPKAEYDIAGFSAFTPAGACAMFNNNFDPDVSNGGINSSNDLKWYLPANHEGIWASTTGLFFLGTSDIRSRVFWSSTIDNNGYAESDSRYRYNSYTMSHVDIALISGGFSGGSGLIRCIRRIEYPSPTTTYPYMSITNGKPVIVTKEKIGANDQGYVEPSTADGTILTSTRVTYPLRFTQQNSDGSPAFGMDGRGPIKPSENTLAPKFQVACNDAGGTSTWLVGSGWNTESNNWANPRTGCAAYNEGGYTDWRMPTNAELRIMLLMGAGLNGANLPQNPGSDDFAAVPGFTRMNGSYWTGRDYVASNESGVRVYYLTISSGNITGSSVNKTSSSYRTRCVRDIKD